MPPSKIRKNLIGLITLAPNIEDNLMEKIDLPLCTPPPLTPEIEHADPDRPFLKTEFNRDGDSYRSCLTNAYHPSAEGYTPSPQFRRAEEVANDLFAEYTKLYYGPTAVGSFFLTEGETANAFSCGYFAKKSKGLLR